MSTTELNLSGPRPSRIAPGPLTILLVNPYRGIVGPNIGAHQMVREAIARGHRVHVAVYGRDEFVEDLEALGATYHVIPQLAGTPRSLNPLAILRHGWSAWRVTARLGRLAKETSADVICLNSINSLLAPRAGRIACRPVAAISRSLGFAELGLAGKAFFRLQRRWVDRYVTVIELGKELLARQGVPREKIIVVHNGVDLEQYTATARDQPLASELGITGTDRVIGTVSHLTPRKGVDLLVEAMGLLAKRLPEAKCLIIGGITNPGEEWYEEAVRRRIGELGLEGQVSLTGYRKDIGKLMGLMDVYVLPSRTENCPRSALEAQACERPVVGFRVGGMPEVVADGETGLLVEPFDVAALAEALHRLLLDAPLRRKLGAAGRARVERLFNLKTNLSAIIDLLERMAELGRQERQGASCT